MFTNKWNEILNEVEEFNRHNQGQVWFRGLNKASNELNSGLFRLKIGSIDDFISLETQFYNYFKNLGYYLHGGDYEWNLLYSMQHYGVKTRLLDWTESFSVALYFATLGWDNNTCRIWMLNPTKVNLLSLAKEEIISPNKLTYTDFRRNLDQKSIAIYPIKNNPRIVAQSGVFIVQGNSLLSFEKEFGAKLITQNALKYIDLSIDVREDVLKYLTINNVNNFSLFPDLSGLAEYLNNWLINPSWL